MAIQFAASFWLALLVAVIGFGVWFASISPLFLIPYFFAVWVIRELWRKNLEAGDVIACLLTFSAVFVLFALMVSARFLGL